MPKGFRTSMPGLVVPSWRTMPGEPGRWPATARVVASSASIAPPATGYPPGNTKATLTEVNSDPAPRLRAAAFPVSQTVGRHRLAAGGRLGPEIGPGARNPRIAFDYRLVHRHSQPGRPRNHQLSAIELQRLFQDFGCQRERVHPRSLRRRIARILQPFHHHLRPADPGCAAAITSSAVPVLWKANRSPWRAISANTRRPMA